MLESWNRHRLPFVARGRTLIPGYWPILDYSMDKTLGVSEEYHRLLKAHNRDDETMEETLKRLTGGPDPRLVAGIVSEESADEMREAVENLRDRRPG